MEVSALRWEGLQAWDTSRVCRLLDFTGLLLTVDYASGNCPSGHA